MQQVMSDAFSDEWSPILRVRVKDGNQVYMNMRESGKNVKILMVKIERDEAVVVRAKFNPNKLAKFIENPKIFGVSLDGRSGKSKISMPQNDEDKTRIIFEDDEDEDPETDEDSN